MCREAAYRHEDGAWRLKTRRRKVAAAATMSSSVALRRASVATAGLLVWGEGCRPSGTRGTGRRLGHALSPRRRGARVEELYPWLERGLAEPAGWLSAGVVAVRRRVHDPQRGQHGDRRPAGWRLSSLCRFRKHDATESLHAGMPWASGPESADGRVPPVPTADGTADGRPRGGEDERTALRRPGFCVESGGGGRPWPLNLPDRGPWIKERGGGGREWASASASTTEGGGPLFSLGKPI